MHCSGALQLSIPVHRLLSSAFGLTDWFAMPAQLSEEDQLRSQLLEFRDPIPDVEWWDRLLLVGGKYHSTPSNGGSTKTLDDEHVDGGAGDGDDVGVSKDHAAAEQDDMDTVGSSVFRWACGLKVLLGSFGKPWLKVYFRHTSCQR